MFSAMVRRARASPVELREARSIGQYKLALNRNTPTIQPRLHPTLPSSHIRPDAANRRTLLMKSRVIRAAHRS